MTRIVGPVPDQSMLFGLLDMFDGLHIEVVSVNPVGTQTPIDSHPRRVTHPLLCASIASEQQRWATRPALNDWNDMNDLGFWGWIAWFFWVFVFFAYLMVLFSILSDLFRDHKLSGWWKAVWIIFLIFVPFLTALVYLIARGNGMTQARHGAGAGDAQGAGRVHPADGGNGSGGSSVDDIAKAKSLLDSGAITQAEFDAIKSKALAS